MRRTGLAGLLSFALSVGAGAEDLFELSSLPGPGRTILVEFADLDGDGAADLLSASFLGLRPREVRQLNVRYQRTDGSLPAEPDWSGPLVEGAAAYDLARLSPGAAEELLLLLRDRLVVMSFAGRTPETRELPLPGPAIGLAGDERGLERLRLAHGDLSREVRLLVPGLGESYVLSARGELVSRLAVGGRANYFVPPRPGPVFAESEIEVSFDVPRLSVGDVDGDGRSDLLASNRHEVRTFLQREDGSFPEEASSIHALRRLSEADHIRQSGSVRVDAGDFQGDGLTDLLVAQSSGGFIDSESEIALYVNRAGSWQLDEPDQRIRVRGTLTHQLVDIDSDGRLELVDAHVPLGVLDLVEVLVTRGVDARVSVRRLREASNGAPFGDDPWFQRSIEVSFSFEKMRPRGFLPTLAADLNGDGFRELLSSGGGDTLEVHLGQRERGWERRPARQKLDTEGLIRFGDLDSDGLTDFALYDPRRPDTPIRLGINRGQLPGTPKTAHRTD